jgi:hypothetical protein
MGVLLDLRLRSVYVETIVTLECLAYADRAGAFPRQEILMNDIRPFLPSALMAFCALPFASLCWAQNPTTSGEFTVEPPTPVSLGFEWRIQGDDNRNAAVEVSYRKKGQSEWRTGLPLMRSQHEETGVTPAPAADVARQLVVGKAGRRSAPVDTRFFAKPRPTCSCCRDGPEWQQTGAKTGYFCYWELTGVWGMLRNPCNLLILLVAGEGFEPSTFGL